MFYTEEEKKKKKNSWRTIAIETCTHPNDWICTYKDMNVQNVKIVDVFVNWWRLLIYNSSETNNALSQERQLPFHNFVYELEILFIVFYLAHSNALAPASEAIHSEMKDEHFFLSSYKMFRSYTSIHIKCAHAYPKRTNRIESKCINFENTCINCVSIFPDISPINGPSSLECCYRKYGRFIIFLGLSNHTGGKKKLTNLKKLIFYQKSFISIFVDPRWFSCFGFSSKSHFRYSHLHIGPFECICTGRHELR